MKNLNDMFLRLIILFFIIFPFQAHSKNVAIGNLESKITIKVFSSLTCPACANFHSKIYYKLKKDFIDKGLVRFEHHPFFRLSCSTAEIILRCDVDNSKIELWENLRKNKDYGPLI